MPIVYRCRRCGVILYYYDFESQKRADLYYAPPTPEEVALLIYHGRCPRCGTPLNPKPSPSDIRIEAWSKKKQYRLITENNQLAKQVTPLLHQRKEVGCIEA